MQTKGKTHKPWCLRLTRSIIKTEREEASTHTHFWNKEVTVIIHTHRLIYNKSMKKFKPEYISMFVLFSSLPQSLSSVRLLWLHFLYMLYQKENDDRTFEILLTKLLEEMQNQMEFMVESSWRKWILNKILKEVRVLIW